MKEWVDSIGLTDFTDNLTESGVHGGVFALDNGYDHQKLALALRIPLTDPEVSLLPLYKCVLSVQFSALWVQSQ